MVSDLTTYERFLKERLTRVGGVVSIESSFALNQVQYSTALPFRYRMFDRGGRASGFP